LNSKRCWRCRQHIPAQAERTGIEPIAAPQPVLVAATPNMAMVPAQAAAPEISGARWGQPRSGARGRSAPGLPDRVNGSADWGSPALATVERKQCDYCREWIDPEASVCPYCRTDQGSIAAVQKATWAFLQLFFCFAGIGVAIVVLVRLWQWGLAGGITQSVSALLGHL
jgi:hypothetical protein